MASNPTFPHFQLGAETWESYMNRFECFLNAIDLTEATDLRKSAYFLSFCGATVFDTASALVSPRSIKAIPWDELREILSNHYSPKPSKIARRLAFRRRTQAVGETVSQYVAALRSAAIHCGFRDYLEDMLLDQIVGGVRDLKLQRRLLAKKDLTLATAIEEAQAAELSELSAAEIQGNTPKQGQATVHYDEVSQEVEEEPLEVNRLTRPRPPPGPPRKFNNQTAKQQTLCISCGGNHHRSTCRFRNVICLNCQKMGHIARVCQAKQASIQRPQVSASYQRQVEHCYTCYHANNTTSRPNKLSISLFIEGKPCRMEVDTGSTLSIISWASLKKLLPSLSKRKLTNCHLTLRDYQGKTIPVLGKGKFLIQFQNFRGHLPLVVVDGALPSLLGLDWFPALGLNVTGIHSVENSDVDALFRDYSDIFSSDLGCYSGTPISFDVGPQATPIRLKPRRVPFAIRPKLDAELDKLIKQGVLEQVDFAKWETPIVTPLKKDGSVRICADYKTSLNRFLQISAYPVPVIQHLLHSFEPGIIFAKLDMSQAYQQFPVDQHTADLQTIVTHRGAFRCKRLQFGVSVAPGIFQSLMERILQGLPGVVPYFDDILVSASNKTQLLLRVRSVLDRFRQNGLKLKKEKCTIATRQVDFLGYRIDASGIHPIESKVRAIHEAPTPTNKTELQAFLGLLNFYASFLPHKASVAEPLHRLLDRKAPWHWGQREAHAFQAVKSLLTSNSVLVQFNPNLPLVLASDASPFGIGAVLSHRLSNGSEAPIAYFSRTFSAAERNYSQIDKEALAAVAAVKKFHEFLYGHSFELVTDHKPLLGLLAGDKQTPQVLSPRMTRWTLFLAAYSYTLVHRPGKTLCHADALSRCPLPSPVEDPAPIHAIFECNELNLPVSAGDIAAHSKRDRVISQVLDWVGRGWPDIQFAPEFMPFKTRRQELSSLQGCLLWGTRVVIPPTLREPVLRALHEGHPGIVRMKALARSYVWWPGLDSRIANWVNTCQPCQATRAAPPAAAPTKWEDSGAPWARLHVDLAGPIQGRTFLVVVDSFSKWTEVALLPSTTTLAVTRALTRLFVTHGLPDTLVSDNGPQFSSNEFAIFAANLGIRHALTAPFHPASNGMAERAVRSAKEVLAKLGQADWHTKLSTYLLTQHATPCPSTNKSPAELLMGRRLRTTLDRLHPHYAPSTPLTSDSHAREFALQDQVYARNYAGHPLWLPGQIVFVAGPRSYRVLLEDGRIWRRHVDQLRRRWNKTATETPVYPPPDDPVYPQPANPPKDPDYLPPDNATSQPPQKDSPEQSPDSSPEMADDPLQVPVAAGKEQVAPAADEPRELRRSGRERKQPSWLKDYACSWPGGRSAVFKD